MLGYNLIKFQNKSYFLNTFNTRYVHKSDQPKQKPSVALTLKTYNDLPGPLELPYISSLLSITKFSKLLNQKKCSNELNYSESSAGILKRCSIKVWRFS